MDTEYDFTQTINTNQLLDEINTAGILVPDYITTDSTFVQIFYINPLTSDQQNILSTVVTNHVANPNYITLAVQIQITTLTNYLTNSNPTIQNTARAAILQNIAPNLPIQTLININTQIHNITGQ